MQLDALPKIEDITQGAQTAQSGATNLAMSMNAQVPPVPILPTLQSLSKLGKSLPGLPLWPCNACNFDIGSIMDGLQVCNDRPHRRFGRCRPFSEFREYRPPPL